MSYTETTMRCPLCGRDRVPLDARFCPFCERVLPMPPALDFSKYITDRTRDFTGREWVFRAIDNWLTDPEGSRIFLLTGEPGCGKTAIAARLVQVTHGSTAPPASAPHLHPGFLSAYHFCSALEARWHNPHRFTESLAQQLSRYPEYANALVALKRRGSDQQRPRYQVVHQEVERVSDQGMVIGYLIEKFEITSAPPEDAFVDAVLEPLMALARQREEQQIVILVDALDEALVYSGKVNIASLLAQIGELPGNVRFLLSSRPGEHLSHGFLQQVQSFWLSEDEEGQLNRRAIQDARDCAVRLAQEKPVQTMLKQRKLTAELLGDKVAEASRGNFLYLYHYAVGLRGGDEDLLDLKALPQGLHGIYQDFLVKVRDKVDNVVYWDQYCKPVLGALAVAREPLLPGQIAGFSGVEKGSVGTILTLVRQFLERIGPEQARRYAVYHSSFGEYLISERNRDCISGDEAHRRVVAYYRRRATSWEDVDWHEVDDYGLRHTAYHLFGAGRELYEDLYELINPDWRRLKLDRLKSDQSFIQDVEWALEAARREKTNRFPRYISLSLMAGSIASKSNDVVPEAIGAMMALGQTERANAYIRTMTDPGIQAGALLQMARALWYLGDEKQANEHLERAIEVGKSAHSILTNPEPLIKDLILFGRTDELVAVGNLLHRRMGSIWNSSLARTLREMAAHILQVQPGRIAQLRARYPDSFGHLVTLDGAVDESYNPPIDEKLMSSGLQSFEPDPEAQEIYEPCLELLQQADLCLSHGDADAAWKSIAEIESIGRQNDWVLSGRGSFSDASEPWWSMLTLYAQVGSTERLDHLIGEIERSLTLSGPAAWGGKFAFSAALGEIAITWARLGNKRQANGMLERVLRFCEMVGYMEWSIGALKMEFALDVAFGYDLYAVSTAVSATLDQGWHAEYARLRIRRAGWRPWWQHPWWQPPVYR